MWQMRVVSKKHRRASKRETRRPRKHSQISWGKYGVRKMVSCSQLSTNPFAFEGEKIAVVVDFEEMLDRDKALFGRECMVVTPGIPARTFSTQRASVVLIGQVIGKTEVKIPLGSIPAAHLRLPVYIFAGKRIVRS